MTHQTYEDMRTYTPTLKTYRVVRRFPENTKLNHVLFTGVDYATARAHCEGEEANSKTCTHEAGKLRSRKLGHWYDAMEVEP